MNGIRLPPDTDVLTIECPLQALQASPDFRGPVEPLHDDSHNNHLSLIYESKAEQLAAAIPFVRQGLERGEQCLYVVDEHSEAEIREELREAGIHVEAALESGALRFETIQDVYLQDGTFDADRVRNLYEDAIAEATAEFEGFRGTADMTWLLDDAVAIEDVIKYESELNDVFDGEDAIALCQYDCEALPADVISAVVRVHPHLIYDNTICHNFYYISPGEFRSENYSARERDRMLGTLRERAEVKAELKQHQRYLHAQNEIVSSPDQTFEEKLQALFELGCERFDLELGAMARVDTDADWFEVEVVSEDHQHFEPGVELPLSETYCTAATEIKSAGSVSDPHEEGYDDIHVYQEFGIRAYLGTYIEVDGGTDRTFFFITSEPREEGFADDEHEFVQSMGQWAKHELERHHRERFLRECYEITSAPEHSFEEKLERLLDLGREWFDFEIAALSQLPEWDGKFHLEKGLGIDPEDEMVWADSGEGCFCRKTITADKPVGRRDIRGTDWEEDPIHEKLGLVSYFGTTVSNGSTLYGTLWFGSTDPRERSFSDTEYTFIDLIGQWVSYELERQEHRKAQQELYEIAADTDRSFTEKLHALFDLGCEQFDMEIGGLATVEPETDRFEVEITNGDHEYLVPGKPYPLSETYCQAAVDEGGTSAVTGSEVNEFEGKLCHDTFGVRTYLGTYLEIDGGTDRTFWFVSTESRADGFSETERTFQHLMGQWVQYELERQQREQELRERTDHLSALIETTPECIKTVAADGTLLQMNPAGLNMVEADSESDVIGGCVYDLIAPEHRERFREFNERICQGERGTLEFDVIGLEGTRRHMETHAAPLSRPDGTTAQIALTRDVTEQVKREDELERALDLLEKTERIAEVGGWEIDPETEEVFWTDHIFELLEVPGGEEPPLDEALSMYHEEDQPTVEAAIDEAIESGDPFDVEVRVRTRNDDIRWLRLQGVPETTDREVVSFRGAAQDITARKQREQRLKEVIERLEASNERLEQFAYAASHDLQEPLRMVSSYLKLIEHRYEDDLDDDGEEFLEYAINGADRMRNMIEALLEYSRVETRGDPLEPIDLDTVFDDVLDDLGIQIEQSGAEIAVDSLPQVRGDRQQIRHLFQNLVDNAITYSGAEPPQMHVSAERDGSEWIVSVRDEGIGIDPEYRDEVFEVFRRLHSQDEYSGSGIGLALCQRIIERHEGEIWVESEPGEGSTFLFTLPALA